MENNIDPGLQSEIWRHYQGMKAIQRQLPDEPKFSFKLDAFDDAMDYMNIPSSSPYAADTISLSTGGDDVITFS
jgi:hypothetical protein